MTTDDGSDGVRLTSGGPGEWVTPPPRRSSMPVGLTVVVVSILALVVGVVLTALLG
jgi:hypothetical protein